MRIKTHGGRVAHEACNPALKGTLRMRGFATAPSRPVAGIR